MKKLQAIILAAAMLVSLAACASDTEVGAGSRGESESGDRSFAELLIGDWEYHGTLMSFSEDGTGEYVWWYFNSWSTGSEITWSISGDRLTLREPLRYCDGDEPMTFTACEEYTRYTQETTEECTTEYTECTTSDNGDREDYDGQEFHTIVRLTESELVLKNDQYDDITTFRRRTVDRSAPPQFGWVDVTEEETEEFTYEEPPTIIGSIDFGVFAFNSQQVVIPPETGINVGGNMNTASSQGGGGVIRQAGFVGIRGDFECPVDFNGEWDTLISQNGEFWSNISRIEADFYLTSSGNPNDLSYVEAFMLTGGLLGFAWRQTGINLLADYVEERGGSGGFRWGTPLTAVWDIDSVAREDDYMRRSEYNPNGEYAFDNPPIDVSDEGFEPDYRGGGITQFGFMMLNNSVDESLAVSINWTNVTVYVHCMNLFEEHVAMVTNITGILPSAGVLANVREV
jgi:hypothetical protein